MNVPCVNQSICRRDDVWIGPRETRSGIPGDASVDWAEKKQHRKEESVWGSSSSFSSDKAFVMLTDDDDDDDDDDDNDPFLSDYFHTETEDILPSAEMLDDFILARPDSFAHERTFLERDCGSIEGVLYEECSDLPWMRTPVRAPSTYGSIWSLPLSDEREEEARFWSNVSKESMPQS